MKTRLLLLTLMLTFVAMFAIPVKQAHAVCLFCCSCTSIRNYIINEIKKHETFLTNTFWGEYLGPTLAVMTNQIDAGIMQEATSIGTFFDAQNNIDQARVLQELSAESATSYLPSEQLCRFATLGQGLASSESVARANKLMLLKRSQNRQLGQPNMAASTGGASDDAQRMEQYRNLFCDRNDNNGKMKLCKTTDDKYLNADIDYVKSVDTKPTLDIDFTAEKTTPTDDERAILALSDNLFAHELFSRPAMGSMKSTEMSSAKTAYMDMRALIAKRSVAENSFNTLVAMKSKGTGTTTEYIKGILREMGVSEEALTSYLGPAPSYDAQMEVLTKKIYQNPAFYVNLMDNPANVQRQYAAMQSFGLMQQRDIFDSILRSEMLLSLIVELEVGDYQNDAQALIDKKKL